MKLNNRITVFIVFVITTVIAIQLIGLPAWLLTTGAELLVSFLISGGLYALLSATGFEFLKEIKLKYSLSAMTLTVFLLKHLLI